MKKLLSAALPWSVFVLFASYMLYVMNADLLWQAQNYSYWADSHEYLQHCLAKPAGLLTWCSTFLTQMFYNPAAGVIMILAIWSASYAIGMKAFGIRHEWSAAMILPFACLLASIVGMGYWLYYLKMEGYWMAGTLGVLLSMTFTLAASLRQDRWWRLAWMLIAALLFPQFGIHTLAAVVYIAADTVIGKKTEKAWIEGVTAVWLCIVTPLVCYNMYDTVSLEKTFTAGIATLQQTDKDPDIITALPQWLTLVAPLAAILVNRIRMKENISIAIGGLTAIACCAWCYMFNISDVNFHAEMRMQRCMQEYRWNDLLREMTETGCDATRAMVLMKNCAVFENKSAASSFFTYKNTSEDLAVRDTSLLNVHTANTIAPRICLHHGKVNFAYRWAMENSVEYGNTVESLKTLVLCAIINREYNLAKKYLMALSHTTFHKEWADRYMKVANNPSLVSEFHELDIIRELHGSMGSVFDTDQGVIEAYLLKYFANSRNSKSPTFVEMSIIYSMVSRDIENFWPHFFTYARANMGKEMPRHYQEAAILFGNLESTIDVSQMPFDEDLRQQFNTFQQITSSLVNSGVDEKVIGEQLRPSFERTYWYYYFFCKGQNTY